MEYVMQRFSNGKKIKTTQNSEITILEFLAEGGQASIYRIRYNNIEMALKWYDTNWLNHEGDLYNNLLRLVERICPDNAFMWPKAITEKTDGSFGIVMELGVNADHKRLSQMLFSDNSNKVSLKTAVIICINIISAFQKLHNEGFVFPCLDDSCFYVDIKKGEITICDTEMIIANGERSHNLSDYRYAPPEIVLEPFQRKWDYYADDYSISVLLFYILLFEHPLKGKRFYESSVITETVSKYLFGTHPVFIFNPSDNTNCPDDKIQGSTIKRWNSLPEYIKEAFIKAFSEDALTNPTKRIKPREWYKILNKFRNEIN